jgi:hypothetical protein
MHLSIPRRFWVLSSLSLTLLASISVRAGLVSYANDFVDPDYIVKGNFGENTLAAQSTIVTWARQSSDGGPWCTWSLNV